jgi:hypothetical protein
VLCTLFSFHAKSQNDYKTDSTHSSVFEIRKINYWDVMKEKARPKFQDINTDNILTKKCISHLDFTNLTKIQVSNMGWFCKKELEMDKRFPLLLRFRLGNLDYVNFLEGKK